MQFEPLIVPFIFSLVISITLTIYALRHPTGVSRVFALAMGAVSIWTFCYIAELSSISLESKTFWLVAKYIGSGTAPTAWFVFSAYMTHNVQLLSKPLRIVLLAYTGITWLVVLTNDLHHWMWTYIHLVPGFPETQVGHGGYFWVYSATTYLLLIASVVLYFNHYRTTPAFFRKQAALLIVAGTISLAGRIPEDIFNLHLIPQADTVVLFLLFTGIFCALALFRFGALTILPIAHTLVVYNIQAGIIVLDASGRIVELNPFALHLLNTTHRDSIGKLFSEVITNWLDVMSPRHTTDALNIENTLANQFETEQEIMLRQDGKMCYFSVQRSVIKEANGVNGGTVIVLFDITARKEAEMKLAEMARTDGLTGVTNRRYFLELAEYEVERARRYSNSVSILLIDVYHFKGINDTYGHHVGDEVLRFVASAGKVGLRSTDIFARYGGEEFICLLCETSHERALEAAERIRTSVSSTPFKLEGHLIPVTISVGVSQLEPGDLDTLAELIREADEALYRSKAGGRNMVTAHS